ncbi:glycerate kinase family protein [Caldalkalibacillus mannanilyticus]|uniref:glycerate kinase family protein n=1 Tax=Caldalkalibacillus mannanilyticus TaxID=1418 RepID=UPI000AF9516B
MKVIVAPDSFKGSLSAQEVGNAMKEGILLAQPQSQVKVIPMADGGEGTLQCLIEVTGGKFFYATVKNPRGKEIQAAYGVLGDGITCVIELAQSSGLYLLDEKERNPLYTTTFGFGQLIKAGLDRGCRRFILGLGGSATNDGGAGMLQALGFGLLDKEKQPIHDGGAELERIVEITTEHGDPRLAESNFIMACDVDNPLIGPVGASAIFGPQKGATPDMVHQLDHGLQHFANVIAQQMGIAIHHLPGSGAAGGVAGALLAFLDAPQRSGVQVVMELTKLEQEISQADLVITGEGQVDGQTAHGKTPCGVAQMAQKYGVPTIVLAGSVGQGIEKLYDHGVTAVFSILNQPFPFLKP